VRISLPSLSFSLILFTHLFLDSCAAEQALINGSHSCVITFRPGLQYDHDFLQLILSTRLAYQLRCN
jgi:hypothetical protein